MLKVFGGDSNAVDKINFSGKAYVDGSLQTFNNLQIKGLTYNGTKCWGEKENFGVADYSDADASSYTLTVYRYNSQYNRETIGALEYDYDNSKYYPRYGDEIEVSIVCTGSSYIDTAWLYDSVAGAEIPFTKYSNMEYRTARFIVNGNLSLIFICTYPQWRTIWTGRDTLYLDRTAGTYTKNFGSLNHEVSNDMPLRITTYGTKDDSTGSTVTISKQDIEDAGSTGVAYQVTGIANVYRFRGLSNSGTNAVTVTIYSSNASGCTVHFTKLQAYY